MPTHTEPSASGRMALTSAPGTSGVSSWGVRLCSPSIVPTQMLPSRSSSSDWTASLESPVCMVARSMSGARPFAVSRTRQSPWPVVATHRLFPESCRRRMPRPSMPVNGARAP